MTIFYAVLKCLIISAICLAASVQVQKDIKPHYNGNLDLCNTCYDNAVADPDHMYEFGYCSKEYSASQPNWDRLKNLLWDRKLAMKENAFSFKPTSSVGWIVVTPSIFFALLVLMGCMIMALIFAIAEDNDDEVVTKMDLVTQMGFWLALLNMVTAYSVWALYEDADGCYVTAVGKDLRTALIVIAIVALVFLFGEQRVQSENKRIYGRFCMFMYIVYGSLALAALDIYSRNSGDKTAVVVGSVILASMIECPLIVFVFSFFNGGIIFRQYHTLGDDDGIGGG